MSIGISIRRVLRIIRESLPGASTAASRMYTRARSQKPWMHVPPHQQAQAFAQHQQVLKALYHQHVAGKVAPFIIDWLYGVVTSPKFWKLVEMAAFILFAVKSYNGHGS